MPFCPYCKKEIDYLEYWEEAANIAKFDGNGDYWDWNTVEVYRCGYDCPECGATLFDNHEDAVKFLNDGVEAHIKAMGNAREE